MTQNSDSEKLIFEYESGKFHSGNEVQDILNHISCNFRKIPVTKPDEEKQMKQIIQNIDSLNKPFLFVNPFFSKLLLFSKYLLNRIQISFFWKFSKNLEKIGFENLHFNVLKNVYEFKV